MREIEWISQNQEEVERYSGKWVALSEEGIIASGDSISQVKEKLEKKETKKLPTFIKIPRKDEDLSIL